MDPVTANYLRLGLIYYIFLLCSICIHEWAHAFIADKLGGPLPRYQGRVTLNPVAHIDVLGTVFFPLIMIFWPMFSGSPAQLALIGWGKPVELSLPNAKTRTRDDYLITLAGPFANLVLCALFALIGGFIGKSNPGLLKLFQWGILINAGLFIFNLIPIPPLDGGHILKNLVKMKDETFMKLSRWGFIILLVCINIPFFRYVMGAAIFTIAGIFDGVMARVVLPA